MNDSNSGKVPAFSPNFKTEIAMQIGELIPEVVSDGKIDIEKLSDIISDDISLDKEGFGLIWPGKKRAITASQLQTTATLLPCKERSENWGSTDNVIIEGDNLEVLKVLGRSYHGMIQMIYIDPPYNTSKDFIYPDNFQEGLKSYLEFTKQVDEGGKRLTSNRETDGRFHSNWLSMMYPRLRLAKNLLRDDGVIFVSIDDNEYDNLKKILDEVFGEINYINTFVWVSNLKGRQISGTGAAGTKEYILCYGRNSAKVKQFDASISRVKDLIPSVYRGFDYPIQTDDRGDYVVKNALYNTNSAFNEETRPNLVFDIYYNPDTGDIKTGDVSENHEYKGYEKIPPKVNNNGTHKYHAWRWSRAKIEEESYDLVFEETTNGWMAKTKVRDVDTTLLKDLIMDISTNNGSKDLKKIDIDPGWFDYPKPVDLIKLLIECVTKLSGMEDTDEDHPIVLDFFAGSGTTAHAVMELNAEDGGNRKFIQVQLPEPLPEESEARKAGYTTIADICIERTRAAADSLVQLEESPKGNSNHIQDQGFRVFKLADTNFAKWDIDNLIEPTELENHLRELKSSTDDDASEVDLFFEVLLKLGYPLTTKFETEIVSELTIYLIDNGSVAAYLNEHVKPDLKQLEDIAGRGLSKFVIIEDAFHGDDALKSNYFEICRSKGIQVLTL